MIQVSRRPRAPEGLGRTQYGTGDSHGQAAAHSGVAARARSKSIAVTDAFLAAYKEANGADEIVTVDLFARDLPALDAPSLEGKYAIMHGQEHTPEIAEAWKAVVAVIEEFLSADKYVLAVPMWNFSIPYRLKHYLDILIQPTYTFSFSPASGYEGLVKGKPAFVAYARGGDLTPPELAGMDYQKTYLDLALGFMGFTDIRSVIAQPMLMGGPEVAGQKLDEAVAQARELAKAF